MVDAVRQCCLVLSAVPCLLFFTGCRGSNGNPADGDGEDCLVLGSCDWLLDPPCVGDCDWFATYPSPCICAEVVAPQGGDASVPSIVEGTLVEFAEALPPDHDCGVRSCTEVTTVLVVDTVAGERFRYSVWLADQPSVTVGEWVRVESVVEQSMFNAHYFLALEGIDGVVLVAEEESRSGGQPTRDIGGVGVDANGSVVGRETSLCARGNYRMAEFSAGNEAVWVRTGESVALGSGASLMHVANHRNVFYDHVECTDIPYTYFAFSIVR